MKRNVALVSGSTHNTGRAIAETLADDGYRVIVTSRHGDEAQAVAGAFRRRPARTRRTTSTAWCCRCMGAGF